MVFFIPYGPDDLSKVQLQPVQQKWAEMFLEPGYAKSLDIPGMAWTGVSDDGRIIGCAGFAPQWKGRVIAWAVFGRVPKKAWPRIVRKVRKEFRETLGKQDHSHRVEITVPHGFGAGCRLAHILGFKVEGLMKHYGPDGADHFLYSQVIPCAR